MLEGVVSVAGEMEYVIELMSFPESTPATPLIAPKLGEKRNGKCRVFKSRSPTVEELINAKIQMCSQSKQQLTNKLK